MSEEEKLLKEAKKLAWEGRLFHKNWKVQNEANIDLAALCDSIPIARTLASVNLGSFVRVSIFDFNGRPLFLRKLWPTADSNPSAGKGTRCVNCLLVSR